MLPIEELLALQNPDGGWAYGPGTAGSWTEPTCYAFLALAASGQQSSPIGRRASEWVKRVQRADGGLAPRESVSESTWQTALALIVPAELSSTIHRSQAEAWLLAQTGRESGMLNRLRLLLAGAKQDISVSYDGWPWYPGAAAWVTPTALSVLALERIANAGGASADAAGSVLARIEQGRSFLLARRCRDGGWNHGSTRALGYDSDSYPETTGTALLALHGIANPDVDRAIQRAEQHLASCQSSEAASWLTLGLLAHGRKPARPNISSHGGSSHGGTMAIALDIIASTAAEGRNVLLP
ncbi:MAG: prenyltransferase/squalene oxidase repeat-containing protein [Bryobacteraceae bacterium]